MSTLKKLALYVGKVFQIFSMTVCILGAVLGVLLFFRLELYSGTARFVWTIPGIRPPWIVKVLSSDLALPVILLVVFLAVLVILRSLWLRLRGRPSRILNFFALGSSLSLISDFAGHWNSLDVMLSIRFAKLARGDRLDQRNKEFLQGYSDRAQELGLKSSAPDRRTDEQLLDRSSDSVYQEACRLAEFDFQKTCEPSKVVEVSTGINWTGWIALAVFLVAAAGASWYYLRSTSSSPKTDGSTPSTPPSSSSPKTDGSTPSTPPSPIGVDPSLSSWLDQPTKIVGVVLTQEGLDLMDQLEGEHKQSSVGKVSVETQTDFDGPATELRIHQMVNNLRTEYNEFKVTLQEDQKKLSEMWQVLVKNQEELRHRHGNMWEILSENQDKLKNRQGSLSATLQVIKLRLQELTTPSTRVESTVEAPVEGKAEARPRGRPLDPPHRPTGNDPSRQIIKTRIEFPPSNQPR